LGGAPVFNWHEIRKQKRKGSKTRPHSSPDPSCGREESRDGAIPFPQKNSLPRRVQISFQDFRQKKFEHQSKNTAHRDKRLNEGRFSFFSGRFRRFKKIVFGMKKNDTGKYTCPFFPLGKLTFLRRRWENEIEI
jgi:hypothetical protein